MPAAESQRSGALNASLLFSPAARHPLFDPWSRATSRMDLGTTFRHNLPALQLTTKDDGHVTILTVDGDLVIGESESLFKRTVTRLIEEGKVNLLVDLRRVGFLDSSGLGALVRAMTMSQKEGGQAKLLGAGPQVRKLLEMTKLDSVFENYTDMESAVSSF
jgi:anti-sigma B factor antagonist